MDILHSKNMTGEIKIAELDRATIYHRWLEFSLNLADIMNITPGRKAKLQDEIQRFIQQYNCPKDFDGSGERLFPYAARPILGWDFGGNSTDTDHIICDHANEYVEEYVVYDKKTGEFRGKFAEQILTCIRAGLDVANPEMRSAGVIGFTVEDIRKAYKSQIPQWLNEVLGLKGDEPGDDPVWL
ncbi:MAG: hypothetical protein PHW62_00070 [Candidatus Ratteibacteria bacterium]|nr:hypothetical protein [Candidatus Ratteibacteria bacterium]